MKPLLNAWLVAALAVLVACGGGGGMAEPAPAPPVALSSPGLASIGIHRLGSGWAVLQEELQPLALAGPWRPMRRLTLWPTRDAAPLGVEAPAGRWMIDAVTHPSGEITALWATDTTLELARLAADGRLLARQPLADGERSDDPFIGPAEGSLQPGSAVPAVTLDASALAAVGEDVVLAWRSGRHAVLAQRFRRDAGGLAPTWRRVVEPGLAMFARRLISGTFDVYGQLDNPWRVHVAADSTGQVYVAVAQHPAVGDVIAAHAQHFGDGLSAASGVLMTRLAADGRRIGTTLLPSNVPLELHGLQAWAGGVALVGRVRTALRDDGSGWDGWAAWVQRDSGAVERADAVDVSAGEVLMAALHLGGDDWLLSGSSGYTQNPNGASISESASPLLLRINKATGARSVLPVAAGPRHNIVQALLARGSDVLIAGRDNAPGTHSADADPGALVADGFVRGYSLP